MKYTKLTLPLGTLVPKHIAIIPDGNRRWARARNLPVFEGHRRGFDITPEIAKACRDFGVHTLTIWAFSTENWDRKKEEIDFLMKKYEDFVEKHLEEAKKEEVRIYHLGRKDRIPLSLRKKIENAEEQTKNNKKYILNIALDYGGRDDILRAIYKIIKTNFSKNQLDEEDFKNFLDTKDQLYPYPDLIIRTSGEQRTSGLLSWQAAYSELYWTPKHFPDFTPEDLKEAIIDYSRRRRRFGGDDFVPKVKFDSNKVARIEAEWWRVHNQKSFTQLKNLLSEWVFELYGIKKEDSLACGESLLKAIIYHNKRKWKMALKEVEKYYQILKKKTGYLFVPKEVAKLEINWWRIHDELSKDLDKQKLEKAFQDFYGELYRLSTFQTKNIAYWKTLATVAHDLAEEISSKQNQNKFWGLVCKYLTNSYQALREAAS